MDELRLPGSEILGNQEEKLLVQLVRTFAIPPDVFVHLIEQLHERCFHSAIQEKTEVGLQHMSHTFAEWLPNADALRHHACIVLKCQPKESQIPDHLPCPNTQESVRQLNRSAHENS
jgi:hypothetical protein